MMLFVKSAYNNVVSFYQKSADQSVASAQIVSVSKPIRRFRAWHYLALALVAFWVFFAVALFQIDFDLTVLAIGVVALSILTVFSLVIIILARAFQNNL
ncbi:MAG TPA: hypothetical protein VKY19_28360 [Ktedonosporobacter sp.]|jgi:hypothetical protein|nr:hypothetical protein [Ktedonosporobacter sp.]